MVNGYMRVIGTTVYLKNTLGDGYQIDLAFVPSKEQLVHRFVLSIVPTAELMSSFWGGRTYKVGRRDASLATLFEQMNRRPKNVGILTWGLRQATLEQVFLKIAAEASEEQAASAAEQTARAGGKAPRLGLLGLAGGGRQQKVQVQPP
jgi:hypothetical protein